MGHDLMVYFASIERWRLGRLESICVNDRVYVYLVQDCSCLAALLHGHEEFAYSEDIRGLLRHQDILAEQSPVDSAVC